MTWKSHKTLSFFCGLLFLSVFEAVVLAFASLLPDAVEGPFRARHRGFSHEFFLWSTLTLLFFFLPFHLMPSDLVRIGNSFCTELVLGAGIFLPPQVLAVVLKKPLVGPLPLWVLSLGGVLHWLQDLLTPSGVPFMGKRVAIPLVRTGTSSEFLLVASSVILLLVAIFITSTLK